MSILLFNTRILTSYMLQRAEPWQSQDKDDDQHGAGILHAVCLGKDMPVFANVVAFAVAMSDIAVASI